MLIQISDVKDFLGIVDTSDDILLLELIKNAQKEAEIYCQRNFEETEITEYYDGDGTEALFLNNYPIISITSIYDDITRIYGADTLIKNDNLVIYKKDGLIIYDGGVFNTGRQNIKITYRYGYGGSQDDSEDTPEDLKQALVMLVASLYLAGKAGVNVAENQEIVYRPNYLRKEAYKILDLYRRLDK